MILVLLTLDHTLRLAILEYETLGSEFMENREISERQYFHPLPPTVFQCFITFCMKTIHDKLIVILN